MSRFGAEYDRATMLPRSQWTKDEYLLDPVHGTSYYPTEVGYMQVPPLDRMVRVEDYNPIATWGAWDPNHRYWDSKLIQRFGPEYTVNKGYSTNRSPDVNAQVRYMGKSFLRKKLQGTIGAWGAYAWANWTNIAPSWFIMNLENVTFLRSEAELGLEYTGIHGESVVPERKLTLEDLIQAFDNAYDAGEDWDIPTLIRNAVNAGYSEGQIKTAMDRMVSRELSRRPR